MSIDIKEIISESLKKQNFIQSDKNIERVLGVIDSDINMLTEGTWQYPHTFEQASKLQELMKKPILAAEAGDLAKGSELNKLIGDDGLYDEISRYDLDEDIRPAVSHLLARWVLDADGFSSGWDPRALEICRKLAMGYYGSDSDVKVVKDLKNPTKVDLEIKYARLIHKLMSENRELLIRLVKEFEIDDERGDRWVIYFDDNCCYFSFYYNNRPGWGPVRELSKGLKEKYGVYDRHYKAPLFSYGTIYNGEYHEEGMFERQSYSLNLDDIKDFRRRHVMEDLGGQTWTHNQLLESMYNICDTEIKRNKIINKTNFIDLFESKSIDKNIRSRKYISESDRLIRIGGTVNKIVYSLSESLDRIPIKESIRVDDVSIEDMLKDINSSMKSMQAQKAEIDKAKCPSNIKMMFGGANDSQILKILYSTGLDRSLDGIFTAFMHGDYDKVSFDSDAIFELLNKFGLGNDTQVFQGEISNMFIGNIRQSITTDKFNKMSSNLRKCIYIISNLKKEAKTIDDPNKKAKFNNSIYAFKKILKLVRSIYKNRDVINQRSLAGINSIMFESKDEQIVYLVGIN